MSPEEALATRLAACRDVIEEALIDAVALPRGVDRAPITALLERALAITAKLATGKITDPDHLDLCSAAGAAITGCATVLRVGAAPEASATLRERLRAARRGMDVYRRDALEALAVLPPMEAPPKVLAPLRASNGVPALHRIERGPLSPRARLAPTPTEKIEGTRDRRAPDDEPSAVLLRDQMRRLAEDCFADLGQLGNLRTPSDEVPWMPELSRFEARLLADLDAIAALGRAVIFDGAPSLRLDVLTELHAWADDAFTADPARAFARAFVLGCVEGEDAARAAVVALRQSHPETHEAQKIALSLASSPAIGPAITSLTMGADPALSAVALDVLAARREGTPAIAAPLVAHPDARVRESAARFLGASNEVASARVLLAAVVDLEDDLAVIAAAAEALARLGARDGITVARARFDEATGAARATFAMLLAIAGGPADCATLVRAFEASPSIASVWPIGWHGHPGSVEPLLAGLRDALGQPCARAFPEAIAGAIHRITGQEIEATIEGARAFEAWWVEARARFGSSDERRLEGRARRHRFGRAFTPIESLDEMLLVTPEVARRALAIEVAVATGARIEVGGWVARQIADIASTRQACLARATFRPGDWPENHLG